MLNMETLKIVFYNNGSVLHMSTLASKGWHGIQAIKAVNNNKIKCKMKLKENGSI